MYKIDKPIVFLDSETTGADPATDWMVSLAIKKVFYNESGMSPFMKNNVLVATDYLFNPGIPISPGASAIHGFTDDMIKDSISFKKVAQEIFDIINDSIIAGYNIMRFDCPILFREFQRAGIFWDYSKNTYLDAYNIFTQKNPRDLTAAASYYLGIDHKEAHDAFADVEVTEKIFNAQLATYQGQIGETIEEVCNYSTFNKKLLDFSGKFYYNDQGQICFSFGKHKDKLATDNLDFIHWMLRSDFTADVKHICNKIINGEL